MESRGLKTQTKRVLTHCGSVVAQQRKWDTQNGMGMAWLGALTYTR